MAKFFVLLMPAWFACGACLCDEISFRFVNAWEAYLRV